MHPVEGSNLGSAHVQQFVEMSQSGSVGQVMHIYLGSEDRIIGLDLQKPRISCEK